MRIFHYLAAGLCALSSPVLAAGDAPVDWRKAATGDVEAAYRITVENHPGMFDKANPGFPRLLERARKEGLAIGNKATSAGGYEAAIGRFRAVINDGHAGAYTNVPEKLAPSIRWPGFVAAWRGNAMYVYKSAPGGPAAGARIVSCDGKSVRALVAANVFGYVDGVDTPGEWWSTARRLFVDVGNPFVTLPRSCTFEQGSKRDVRTLAWSALPDYYQEWKNGSANGDLLPIGLTEKAPGLFWYALPDFQPDDTGVAAYKALYADTLAKRSALLGARAIVLDLRFNQGGSSNWSKILAQHLWGEQRVDSALKTYFKKTQVWWRPTKGNLAAIKEFVGLLEQQGQTEMIAQIKQFVPVFEAAIARGDKYFVEPDTDEGATTNGAQPAPLTTPVYVIVPGQCASACLDAIDYFKRFPNTKLIGAPSSADSTYMEVRNEALPSGMANAIIPMKMYVDRPRGKGVYYAPDILMTDFDWSTGNFQKRIEADLKARAK